MAIAVQQIRPVAHVPLVLGVLRRLAVASLIDDLIPPHPAHVLSTGRGVEALVLAIMDGDHALYAAYLCGLAGVMAPAAIAWNLPKLLRSVWPWAGRECGVLSRIVRPIVVILWASVSSRRSPGRDPNFRPTCETRGEPDVKTQRS